MLSSIVRVALAALTLGTLESLRRQLAARPGAAGTGAPPHEESTWEGEGGALPSSGSHLGPDPSTPMD